MTPRGTFFHKLRMVGGIFALSLVLLVSTTQKSYANCVWFGMWVCPLVENFAKIAKTVEETAAEAVQFAEENLANAINTATNLGTQFIKTRMVQATTHAKIQGEQEAEKNAAVAEIQKDATLSEMSGVCAMTRLRQEGAAASRATQAVLDSLSTFSAQTGTGPQADASSAGFVAEGVADLCRLGLLDTSPTGRYANLTTTMNCISNPKFAGAHTDATHILEKLQYPLPVHDHVYTTKNGRTIFSGANGNVSAVEAVQGLGAELDFVAAYKFCEFLKPQSSTPVNGGAQSPAATQSITGDSLQRAFSSISADTCFHAVAYRMSCPLNSANDLKDLSAGGMTCHDWQVKTCQRLKASRVDGGLGLTGSTALYTSALQNCETQGLSQAMYEAILAHRCDEDNYIHALASTTGGKTADVEKIRSGMECTGVQWDYDRKRREEHMAFQRSIGNLLGASDISGGGQPSPVVKQ